MNVASAPVIRERMMVNRARTASYAVIAVLLTVAVVGAVTTHGFITIGNLRAILSQSAYVGVFAVATALIMISGNLFSLSIAATGAVTASCALALLQHGSVIAIVVTLCLAVVIFGLQGFVIAEFGANPIIVTIAAGGLQEGVFLWVSHGATIQPPLGNTGFAFLTQQIHFPVLGDLPLSVYVLFGVVIVLEILIRISRFGRMLYLVGENRAAARAAGLPTVRVVVAAFGLAGLCCGIAGIELGAFNGSGSLLVESNFTYDAIAAAVVGGVAITGGRGRLWQALAGAIFVQAIGDMLLLRGYSEGWQILIKGLIVLGAVVLLRLNQTRTDG